MFAWGGFILYGNKNIILSINNKGGYFEKAKKYIKHYKKVADDLKFISNSAIRLDVLNSLIESPKSPKELNIEMGLEYSSISRALHQLITENLIYRINDKYYVVNSLKFLLPNFVELSDLINFCNGIFNILDDHEVDSIPEASMKEISLLFDATLIESRGMEPHKIYNYIDDALSDATSARCILPFFKQDFVDKLNILDSNNNFVNIKVDSHVFRDYKKNLESANISKFFSKNNFLLIITNKIMILGFFKCDGNFDQNRLIISNTRNSLKWANNLFRYF